MTTLKSPVVLSRTLVGFDVLSYTEQLPLSGDGRVSSTVRKYFDDGSSVDEPLSLWYGDDTPAVTRDDISADKDGVRVVTKAEVAPAVDRTGYRYKDAGQWTDATARAQIEKLLSQ